MSTPATTELQNISAQGSGPNSRTPPLLCLSLRLTSDFHILNISGVHVAQFWICGVIVTARRPFEAVLRRAGEGAARRTLRGPTAPPAFPPPRRLNSARASPATAFQRSRDISHRRIVSGAHRGWSGAQDRRASDRYRRSRSSLRFSSWPAPLINPGASSRDRSPALSHRRMPSVHAPTERRYGRGEASP
jgi:hypothetical protein